MKQNVDLILKNGRVIDGTGAEPICLGVVVVRGNEIIDVGNASVSEEYLPAEVIDLDGMTILPGFINTHVHINFSDVDYVQRWLAGGVTTIRDMGTLADVELAEVIEKREQLRNLHEYPRIVMAGKFVTAHGGYGGSKPVWVDSEKEVDTKVNELLDQGCDLIKTVLEDGFDPSTIGLPQLSVEMLKAITTSAHKRNAWVAAHVSQAHNLQILVDAGIDEAAHTVYDPIPDTLIAQMVQNCVYMTPTMSLYKFFADQFGAQFYPTCVDNLQRFVKAGGKISVGTDFIDERSPWFEVGMPIFELKLLHDAGLAPMQIISAATKNASEVCGLSDKIGTLEKGKLADLIVINGDPLENLDYLTKVKLIIKDGIIVKNTLEG